MTIKEAQKELSAHIKESFCINSEIWFFDNGKIKSEFTVWDGKKHHEGATLADAVNGALMPYRPFNEQAHDTFAAEVETFATHGN